MAQIDAVDFLAGDAHGTRIGRLKTHQQFQQHALTGAAAPEHGDRLASRNAQADPVEDVLISERFSKTLDRDQRLIVLAFHRFASAVKDQNQAHKDDVGKYYEQRGQDHRTGGRTPYAFGAACSAHTLEAGNEPDNESINERFQRWRDEVAELDAFRGVVDEVAKRNGISHRFGNPTHYEGAEVGAKGE